MRSVKIYWVKLMCMSFILVFVTVICTIYLTTGLLTESPSGLLSDKHDEISIGQRFQPAEHIFPEGFRFESPLPRQITNENGQVTMIRRPKVGDLDPKPINWHKNVTTAHLGTQEMPASRPPQVILLGFGKCGTSALLEFLDLHPQIVSLDWEIDYFCDRMYAKYDLIWYVKRMPTSFAGQITIEKSPCYIVEHDAHLRISAMNATLKVMVIVRDPITRLLSEYEHYHATETYWGRPAMSFEDRVFDSNTNQLRTAQILKVGDYNPHLEHLFRVFPRQQVLIIDGDQLVTDPLSQTKRVEEFLGLPHQITEQNIYWDPKKGFYCMRLSSTSEPRCLGKSKGRKHAQLQPDFQRKLINFFTPYKEKFFKLVGHRFEWLH